MKHPQTVEQTGMESHGHHSPSALVLALASPLTALANVGLTQLSSDPFTSSTCTASTTTYHHTEVEPDTYSFGSTIVSAFQVARIFDGGACAIGFATSTNNGSTWTSGLVPGVTKYSGGTLTAPPMPPSPTTPSTASG